MVLLFFVDPRRTRVCGRCFRVQFFFFFLVLLWWCFGLINPIFTFFFFLSLFFFRKSLAYGGKILLHQTRLKLLRGHRYALVGQNGVGKTTLMNAIRNGKLDGWPTHLTCAYVDSGSNVDPVFEQQLMLPYLVKESGKSEEVCVAKLKELDFTDQMMKGSIGVLSGGWQMKHRLVLAVLLDPDIYLLGTYMYIVCLWW